jgi:hypothetical protein
LDDGGLAEVLRWQGRAQESLALLSGGPPASADPAERTRWQVSRASSLYWGLARRTEAEQALRAAADDLGTGPARAMMPATPRQSGRSPRTKPPSWKPRRQGWNNSARCWPPPTPRWPPAARTGAQVGNAPPTTPTNSRSCSICAAAARARRGARSATRLR